jgi:transglutaminase superfamily protein
VNGYFLPAHVYFCGRGDAFVFLDLKHDEYTMLNGHEALAFQTVVRKSSNSLDLALSDLSMWDARVLEQLLGDDLLTRDRTLGKDIRPTAVSLPDRMLFDTSTDGHAAVRLSDIMTFIVSTLIAFARLKFFSIESTVAAVRRRKRRAYASGCEDLDEIRRLVSIFNRLRSHFPSDYLCLFDSLALVEFLAHHDIYPSWTFAVQFEPWSAHCWVHAGNVALNEDLEHIETYVPILEV